MTKLTEAQQKIVAKLQRGDRSKIAYELELTQWGVSRVLRGDYNNDDVWILAAKIVAEHDEVQKELIRVANKLS